MQETRVGYQGVEGSYSSIAVREYFPDATRVGFPTFDEVVHALQREEITHALLPIENSTAGRVADLHHLLPNSGLHIIGEHFLPVHHMLIGLAESSLADITHAYSHREALAQCAQYLRSAGIAPVPFGDTAKAVDYIVEEQNKAYAAVASRYAAELHDDVVVLQENINDSQDNVTRFLVVTKEASTEPDDNDAITSIAFDVLDAPAALYTSLGAFAKNNVNIIKLESFVPMQRHRNAHFYLECIGSPTKPPLQQALQDLASTTKAIEVLGTYAKSPYRAHFEAKQ